MDQGRLWGLVRKLEFTWLTACGFELCKLTPHFRLLSQVRERFLQNRSRSPVLRCHHTVVHPASLTPRRYDSRAAQISQMPRNFWLADPQDLDEIANANFPVSGQIKQAETSGIGQGAEEQVEREGF